MADEIVYVDIADGAKRIMNNTQLYIKLLTKFRNNNNLDDLDAAFTAGDMEKAKNAVHTIKGIAANLSLSELYKQSLELELQVKNDTAVTAQLETVKSVFTATLQEIDKVILKNG